MSDNYLLLYCEALKGIFSIFVSPELHLWLLQLNSQKVPVMQVLQNFHHPTSRYLKSLCCKLMNKCKATVLLLTPTDLPVLRLFLLISSNILCKLAFHPNWAGPR